MSRLFFNVRNLPHHIGVRVWVVITLQSHQKGRNARQVRLIHRTMHVRLKQQLQRLPCLRQISSVKLQELETGFFWSRLLGCRIACGARRYACLRRAPDWPNGLECTRNCYANLFLFDRVYGRCQCLGIGSRPYVADRSAPQGLAKAIPEVGRQQRRRADPAGGD